MWKYFKNFCEMELKVFPHENVENPCIQQSLSWKTLQSNLSIILSSHSFTVLYFVKCGVYVVCMCVCMYKAESRRRSHHWIILQMLSIARTGLNWSQGPDTQFRSLTWMAGTHTLGPSILPPRVYINRKLESEAKTRYQTQETPMRDTGVLTTRLNMGPHSSIDYNALDVLFSIFMVGWGGGGGRGWPFGRMAA